jgi:hypothetical protein
VRRFLVVADVIPPPERRGVITAQPGVVAEGVEWTDRTVVIRWLETPPSTVLWESMSDVWAVIGQASERVEWLDPEEAAGDH